MVMVGGDILVLVMVMVIVGGDIFVIFTVGHSVDLEQDDILIDGDGADMVWFD